MFPCYSVPIQNGVENVFLLVVNCKQFLKLDELHHLAAFGMNSIWYE